MPPLEQTFEEQKAFERSFKGGPYVRRLAKEREIRRHKPWEPTRPYREPSDKGNTGLAFFVVIP